MGSGCAANTNAVHGFFPCITRAIRVGSLNFELFEKKNSELNQSPLSGLVEL